MEFCQQLLSVSPAYRQLVDRFRKLEHEHGALKAAYANAINDQARVKGELKRFEDVFQLLAETIANNVTGVQIAQRDDPGRTGSGR
jgi:phage regulator Rha-like protein